MSKWTDKYLLGEICMTELFFESHPKKLIKITVTAYTIKVVKEKKIKWECIV